MANIWCLQLSKWGSLLLFAILNHVTMVHDIWDIMSSHWHLLVLSVETSDLQ